MTPESSIVDTQQYLAPKPVERLDCRMDVCFVFSAVLRIGLFDLVLGNCEYDEKGCADGDPWWEVVFSDMATGQGYPKPSLVGNG